jgi:LysR family glycine cleavage system transcriptional activator
MSESTLRKGTPPFAALRAFEAVGRLAGVRRAAQALEIDHAVVSRHLRTLEEWTGVKLINRLERKTLLTEAGMRYHARITIAFAEILDATQELAQDQNPHCLNIWCVPGFASEWLMPRLGEFESVHLNIDLELHPTCSLPDFNRYEADVHIDFHYGAREPDGVAQGVRRFEIDSPPWLPVASPARAAMLGDVSSPADLLRAPLVHEENDNDWRQWLIAHDVPVTATLPGPRLWQAQLTLDAARRGLGVALTNRYLTGDDFEQQRLVVLTPPAHGDKPVIFGSYVFCARADRWQTPAIMRFRNWLRLATADFRARHAHESLRVPKAAAGERP